MDSHRLSHLLQAWGEGDEGALPELVPLVYGELRAQASRLLARERTGHTLQPTALVHEVFLRLLGEGVTRWESRAHFFGSAARLMRRVLVDHARRRQAAKRGAGVQRLELDERLVAAGLPDEELLALDEALSRLRRLDPRQCEVVELRYFAGLTAEETAELLGISRATVNREWRTARAWLFRCLAPAGAAP
jgi:RNA polymerase sigma factor (TIGR02999 family)